MAHRTWRLGCYRKIELDGLQFVVQTTVHGRPFCNAIDLPRPSRRIVLVHRWAPGNRLWAGVGDLGRHGGMDGAASAACQDGTVVQCRSEERRVGEGGSCS